MSAIVGLKLGLQHWDDYSEIHKQNYDFVGTLKELVLLGLQLEDNFSQANLHFVGKCSYWQVFFNFARSTTCKSMTASLFVSPSPTSLFI